MTDSPSHTVDGLVSKGEALVILDRLDPKDLLGFDGFYRYGDSAVQPDSAYCFDTSCSLANSAEGDLVAAAESVEAGKLVVGRQIIAQAPDEMWFEIVVR